MSKSVSDFEVAVHDHDAALQAATLEVWVGSEPTFTRRDSEAPEWLSEALGATKQDFAMRIVRTLHKRYPGACHLQREHTPCASPSTNGNLRRHPTMACHRRLKRPSDADTNVSWLNLYRVTRYLKR